MEPKYKAKELIDMFNYQCRECGDIDKAKLIAKECIKLQIKELNDTCDYVQNKNNDNSWFFIDTAKDIIHYLEKVLTEIESYEPNSI